MIRIGLIGTQSMHAWAFAQTCNVPDENGITQIPEAKVEIVYGVDDTQAHIEQTLKKGNILMQASTIDELYQNSDAVMILQRIGSEHTPYACDLIRRGIPVFIDKPVCSTMEDIDLLTEAAALSTATVCGGSGLKYTKQIVMLKAKIEAGEYGDIRSGTIVYSADTESPYDGMFFYLPHAVEMMLELFGYDPVSVKTTVLAHNNFTVCVKYETALVNLVMNGSREPAVIINGDVNDIIRINAEDIFLENMRHFVNQIEKKDMDCDIEKLTMHVRVILAAKESADTGMEAFVAQSVPYKRPKGKGAVL